MMSKSWPTSSAVQCRVSSRKLGAHTDPIFYNRLKRGSEESLERARKRSRTSPDPSEGCSYISKEPQPSPALANTGCPNSTGSRSSKRKSKSDESREGLKKRSRGNPSPSEDHNQTFSGHRPSTAQDGGTPSLISTEGEEKKSLKRKSEEEVHEHRKRSRKTLSPCEGPSHHTATPASSSDEGGTSSSVNTGSSNSRVAFESKYEEHHLLGTGGFGSVYEGYRRHDNMPVAIKHIPQSTVKHIGTYLSTGHKMVPVEVALMLKLKPAEGRTSAAVTLLDWYDLDNELILVQERPVPCLNLLQYVASRGSFLPENEAKVIVRQLVDAVIEVHSKGVFHRDIKMENILIETGSDVPRVRLIDFGCGTYLTKGKYTSTEGTYDYFPPERLQLGSYRAIPTTVWQLGVVVFGMLHDDLPFHNRREIITGKPPVKTDLSSDCQRFIRCCLLKKPEARLTLETLKHHSWLM